jgi:hypothetical protein
MRSSPSRSPGSPIAARWSPQRCPTRLSKIGPSTASSRMQRDSNPWAPVIGTTVVEAIPFAHPGTSPCGSLCTAQVEAAPYPGQPSVRQPLAARRCWELPAFRRAPPVGREFGCRNSLKPAYIRQCQFGEWAKLRSWLGNSRIVQFHAIGTGILGRTLWRTLHLNPSV